MPSKLITAPASEPITLSEAKLHLRVDNENEDLLITSLILAARERVEHLTGRALMQQTWEVSMDCFQKVIRLPKPPLLDITSVKYIDLSGTEQTLPSTDYVVDAYSEPAKLTPAYGLSWPKTRPQDNAVVIRYSAGYSNAAEVPASIKAWLKLTVGTMYAHRESIQDGVSVAELPGRFTDGLLDEFRVY